MNRSVKKVFGPILTECWKNRDLDSLLDATRTASSSAYILRARFVNDKKIVRYIHVLPNSTLYNCAFAIVDAFGFAFDHCFGFYDKLNQYQNTSGATKRYELFSDLDEEEGIEPKCPGTYKTKIKQLWQEVGDTWIFLFDYGDNWLFEVRLEETNPKLQGVNYPHVLNKIGKAPEQYQ